MEELVRVFEEIARDKFPELEDDGFAQVLHAKIGEKKYDLQDEALVEAALREERNAFKDAFVETLEEILERQEDRKAFFLSSAGRDEVVSAFIANAESTIDYYYSAIIGKHFSSS